ncbi:MAG: MG2 domain-containing protein, partial [Bacteroidia bacterium]
GSAQAGSEWQQLTGKITTSDYEDTAVIRKTIHVAQNGKELAVHISQSYKSTEFYFQVDSIERKEKQGLVTVSWNGEAMHCLQTGRQELVVPGLGDFIVSDAKVVDGEDQYIELNFSDPISYNQNLKGIITLQGVDNLTYAIEGNIVKVFLPSRLLGDKALEVTTGIRNFKNFKMNSAYSTTLTFEEPKPMVRIKGNGSILPNSNGLIFPFEAISLKSVDVRVIKIFENNVHQFLQTNNLDGEDGLTRVGKIVAEKTIALNTDKSINLKQWNKHVIDLGKLINPDPGAIYRVSIKFRKEYAACDCESYDAGAEEGEAGEHYNEEGEQVLAGNPAKEKDEDEWNENNWSRYTFNGGYDRWSYYDENYSPCDENYYYGKAVSRNILASDIGLIYKLDDSKLSHAFVSDMISTKPVAGATIEYYDYVKQLIASGVTDANGMLDLQLKRKPFLMLAKYGRQRGYLKLLDGYANSMSKFDVEGDAVQKGVKGFIYGERGVWRPGDSLFLTFIMEDKEKRLPPNHPVKFELHDPNGQLVYQTAAAKNTNGVYDFRTLTGSDALTGNYTAIARVGNRVFSQNLKVETVKPNRLKIYLDFDADKSNDSIAKLSAKWLHGAIAKNLKAIVNVSVNQGKTQFDKFKNYEFDSPVRNYFSDAEVVFDGGLDVKGEAVISTKLSVGNTAPGMLRATYVTKVFEEGGDFSIDRY